MSSVEPTLVRCDWSSVASDPVYLAYHDEEWGVPSRDDRHLFEVQADRGSLSTYLWEFVGGEPIFGRWKRLAEIPAETAESRAMSKDLKRRGFRFVGPTICYAFMQATGLVNDHVVSCFRYKDL